MDDWDSLRYLLAADREGTLAAASRVLGVAPSTVGRRLAALESRVGFRLTTRVPEGTVLTAGAASLVALARDLEARLDVEIRELSGVDTDMAGTVRVTAGDGFMPFVAIALSALRDEHPRLELELIADQRVYDVVRGEADVAIRTVASHADTLVARSAGSMAYGLFAAESYLLRASRVRRVGDLAAHRFVGFSGSLASLPDMRWLARHDVNRFVFRSNSVAALLEAAVAGQGIVSLPRVLAATRRELVPVLPDVDLPDVEVFVVTHRDRRRAARIRAVSDRLRDTLAARFSAS